MKKKIAIIGAGIAGLTFANLIKKNSDHEFMLYEKQESLSLDEAYKILNLKSDIKYTKTQVMQSYKSIMKKIHPDVSPELTRLASIVNEAKEIVIKNIS